MLLLCFGCASLLAVAVLCCWGMGLLLTAGLGCWGWLGCDKPCSSAVTALTIAPGSLKAHRGPPGCRGADTKQCSSQDTRGWRGSMAGKGSSAPAKESVPDRSGGAERVLPEEGEPLVQLAVAPLTVLLPSQLLKLPVVLWG